MIVTPELREERAEHVYTHLIAQLNTKVRVIDPELLKVSNSLFSICITTDSPEYVRDMMELTVTKDQHASLVNKPFIQPGVFDWASDTYIKPAVCVSFLV